MLFPAAILIVVLLAGLTVDGTARYLTHRTLADAAQAAANDAAGAGVQTDEFVAGDGVPLDQATVERAVRHSLAARADPMLQDAEIEVSIEHPADDPDRPSEVRVRITGRVRGVFFPLLSSRISVTAVATAFERG